MTLTRDDALRLLLRHRAMLLGYISMILADNHLVEDVFQEVAIIVVEKSSDLDDAEGFGAWARKIARFKALQALERRSRAPALVDQSILDLIEADWAAGDATPGAHLSEALRGCLEKLSPHSRQLIELRYQRGLGGKAISQTLGQPLNTVYVALSRTYRALASCVKLRLSQERVAYE